MKKKYSYYIGLLEEPDKYKIDLYDPLFENDLYNDKTLLDNGVCFYLDETANVTVTKSATKFNKLTECFLELAMNNDQSTILEKIDNGELFIFRKNLETKNLSLVKITEIKNTIDQLIDNFGDFIFENIYPTINEKQLEAIKENKIIDKFLDIIEPKIIGDFALLTLTNPDLEHYGTTIIKKDGFLVKKLNKEELEQSSERNGLIYEHNLDTLIEFLFGSILNEKPVTFILNTQISNDDIEEKIKRGERVIRKVYGGLVSMIDDNFQVGCVTAKELVKCYGVDAITNEEIPIDENMIYCNLSDESDVICGFDLV